MCSLPQGNADNKKPHAVFVPFPAQGHINPMLKLAKVLYYRGFYITFVNTEHNHKRLLESQGPRSLDGLPGFRFMAIPDGLSVAGHADQLLSLAAHQKSIKENCLQPFRELLSRSGHESTVVPPVSCVVSDGVMSSFTVKAAEEFGIPIALFWTTSACGFMAYMQLQQLIDRGLIPLKDQSYLTNGYLDDVVIDWIPGIKDIRLRDFPTFIRTTDQNNPMLQVLLSDMASSSRAKNATIILNTFEALEHNVLEALSSIFTPRQVFSVGPLHKLLEKSIKGDDDPLSSIGCNLWREESQCLQWLDSKEKGSVVYVNFGSIAVMRPQQLEEFAWGLANSMKPFVWIIRQDLVAEDSAILPPGFIEETQERGVLAGWCNQERVLGHPSVGGYVMHCGWNSTLESLSAGVPVICRPFIAEQVTNCRFLCREWGVGMEIDGEVRREKVERLVRELLDGERGNEMRREALEWKRKAEEATDPGGSTLINLDKLINEVFLQPKGANVGEY